jgi:RsiW-degrading membrane proteinase PrsW (M82 family)
MVAIFGFVPVLLFLALLFLLDSFKLVKPRLLLLCLLYGVAATGLSYFFNTWIILSTGMSFESLSKYVAPITEEFLKALVIFYLVTARQVGFLVDAAIYGFAVGTGFALAENTWYYWNLGTDFNVLLAIIRGFGTALMHGGTMSICAIFLIEGIQRNKPAWKAGILGLMAAIILHSVFNHFLLNPLMQTLLIILILPLSLYLVFMHSTKHLQQWLEVAFSSEVDMLRMIRQGQFRNTRAGQYLATLKEHFESEVLLDLYCFLSLYLELSIKTKRNLMLKENGFPVIMENDIPAKLAEFKQLKKQIGKAGEMALYPLVRMQQRELWELNQLEN